MGRPAEAGRIARWWVVAVGLCVLVVGCTTDDEGTTGAPAPSCEPVAVVVGEPANDRFDLYRVGSDGALDPLTRDRSTTDVAVAPDGSWLVASRADIGATDEPQEVWDYRIVVLDPDGTVTASFPATPGARDDSPAVSPTGDRVAFLRQRLGTVRSEVVVAGRNGRIQRQFPGDGFVGRPAWSPDGSTIAVVAEQRDDGSATYDRSLAVIDVATGRTRRSPIAATATGDPVFSPDGTRVLLSDRGYETPLPITEVDVATGRTTLTLDQPDGATWTNASYVDGDPSRLMVLRFEQTVELEPQRIQVVDRTGSVLTDMPLELLPLAEGGGRTLLRGLSTSACFTVDGAAAATTTSTRPG